MPKTNFNEKSFEKLFLEVKKATGNFSKIDSETISRNPCFMKVFRMLVNKGMPDMGKLLNKTHATIAQYERSAIKKIPQIEAERIAKIISEELPQEINFETALENFSKFKQLSEGGHLLGFKRAESAALTRQEEKIKSLLESKVVDYEVHKTLETSIGQLNYDFWLPRNKIVIECTESLSKHKAESLGFRIIKVKEKIKCKSIAIVPDNVSKGVIRRLQDFDHILFSSNIEELESILK